MAVQCYKCGMQNRDNARFCTGCGIVLAAGGAVGGQGGATPQPPLGMMPTGLLPTNALLSERYQVLRKVGQGGMGAVYLARDLRLAGKFWAIKEMSEAATDPTDRQRIIRDFQREAQLLCSLEHPNIPKVTDSFQEGGRYYLVMEYVEGNTLDTLMQQRNGPFPEADVRAWGSQLCSALAYLHAHNPPVLFRDLKPQNIMITRDGQVKLIDFGIARLMRPDRRTDTTNLGTPGYAAPEQYQGRTEPRSDLYALAVTLHQLLTGYDPGSTPFNLPLVRQLNPTVSREMEQVVTCALQPALQHRWPSAEAMRGALQSSQPLPSSGSGSVSPLGPTPLGHGGGAAGVYSPHATRTGSPGGTSRPTTRLLMAAATLSTRQLAVAVAVVMLVVVVGVWGLAPIIRREVPQLWNNIPTFILAGPLAFAAARRRGAALLAHLPITLVFWLALTVRLGYTAYLPALVVGAVGSGLVLEAIFQLLPKTTARVGSVGWEREVIQFAGAAVAGAVSFYVLRGLLAPNYDQAATRPLLWVCAALLGAAAWFVGDAIKEWIAMRKPQIP